MAKQIKKVLFHQVSAFLGLAIIVAFSSIFGAILLRQVLAAPAGQGSVITALTDIKGAGFATGTHSLKQIRDKLETMGGGSYYIVTTRSGIDEFWQAGCQAYPAAYCPVGGWTIESSWNFDQITTAGQGYECWTQTLCKK